MIQLSHVFAAKIIPVAFDGQFSPKFPYNGNRSKWSVSEGIFFLEKLFAVKPNRNFRQFWLNKLNKCAPMRRRGLPSYWEFGFLLPGVFDSLSFLSVRALFSGFRDGLPRKNKIRQIIATSLSLRHRLAGSLHVSGKLPTYPFPKPFCPKLMLA